MTRRDSLRLTAQAGAAVLLSGKKAQAGTSYLTINAAFAGIGFDPLAPGSAHVVIFSDIHLDPYGHNSSSPQPTMDDRLVNAVMAINPPPTRIIMTGDVAISSTEYFGKPFTEADRTRTLEELQCGKGQLQRFAPIPMDVMIGNHDGHAYDLDHALFHQVFPDEPDYRERDIGGVRFYELNGHHSGYVDAAQEAWLQASVDALDPYRELVVCIHQPSLGSVQAERGIGQTFRRVFANHYGKIWAYGGHAHQFSWEVFQLPHTTITQIGVTTANPVAFNDGQNPGFIVICLSNGKVKGNIKRNCRVPTYENFSYSNVATIMAEPWDGTSYRMATFEEGFYDRTGIVVSFSAGDTGTWFSYTGNVVYRLPLAALQQRPDRFLVLASSTTIPPLFEFSLNEGVTWIPASFESFLKSVYTVALPPSVKAHPAPLARVRIPADRFDTQLAVAGFALSAHPTTITAQESWRYEHFNTLLSKGNAADSANPAGDGLCNLLKYAFGLNPTKFDRRVLTNPFLGGEPLIEVTPTGASIQYVRRIDSGLVYQAETSTDLADWSPAPASISASGVNSTWELVTATVPVTTTKQFWRVKVTN